MTPPISVIKRGVGWGGDGSGGDGGGGGGDRDVLSKKWLSTEGTKQIHF